MVTMARAIIDNIILCNLLALPITCPFFFLIQSILEHNGGAVVAMMGKDCVAIATDLRFGVQACTLDNNFPVSNSLIL